MGVSATPSDKSSLCLLSTAMLPDSLLRDSGVGVQSDVAKITAEQEDEDLEDIDGDWDMLSQSASEWDLLSEADLDT